MQRICSDRPSKASFYDFYDGPEWRDTQMTMYRDLATETGGPILDLTCGTGIHTIDLARAGFTVTGLDVSADMLYVAAEKVSREDPEVQSRIRFVECNMSEFELGEEFGAVLIPCNSFGYLLTLEQRRSCLRAIHRHLRPDGILVIEERNYSPEMLMRLIERRATQSTHEARTNPDTGKFTTFNRIDTHVDTTTQTIRAQHFIDEVQEDGTIRRYMGPNDGKQATHYFHRCELELLIEGAGFAVRDVWGGANKSPLRSESYNMIFVAERKLQ